MLGETRLSHALKDAREGPGRGAEECGAVWRAVSLNAVVTRAEWFPKLPSAPAAPRPGGKRPGVPTPPAEAAATPP